MNILSVAIVSNAFNSILDIDVAIILKLKMIIKLNFVMKKVLIVNVSKSIS